MKNYEEPRGAAAFLQFNGAFWALCSVARAVLWAPFDNWYRCVRETLDFIERHSCWQKRKQLMCGRAPKRHSTTKNHNLRTAVQRLVFERALTALVTQ